MTDASTITTVPDGFRPIRDTYFNAIGNNLDNITVRLLTNGALQFFGISGSESSSTAISIDAQWITDQK